MIHLLLDVEVPPNIYHVLAFGNPVIRSTYNAVDAACVKASEINVFFYILPVHSEGEIIRSNWNYLEFVVLRCIVYTSCPPRLP